MACFQAAAPMASSRVTPHGEKAARTVTSDIMTTPETKASRLWLALGLGLSTAVLLGGITGCISDEHPSNPNSPPPYFKPTWSGDDHAQPVYTSPPVVAPATNNRPATNSPP